MPMQKYVELSCSGVSVRENASLAMQGSSHCEGIS